MKLLTKNIKENYPKILTTIIICGSFLYIAFKTIENGLYLLSRFDFINLIYQLPKEWQFIGFVILIWIDFYVAGMFIRWSVNIYNWIWKEKDINKGE